MRNIVRARILLVVALALVLLVAGDVGEVPDGFVRPGGIASAPEQELGTDGYTRPGGVHGDPEQELDGYIRPGGA